MQLSDDQNVALKKLKDWYFGIKSSFGGSNSKYITLGGYAGTGKTTLMSVFRDEIRSKSKESKESKNLSSSGGDKVIFCSYTGKATRVLDQKLKASGVVQGDDEIGTIHAIMYSPRLDKNDQIVGWDRKDKIEADLIIVDEASMVNEYIYQDLLSYGIPIVFVGDHGQLPPIEGRFNLMDAPSIVLNKVHRQAADNPIIAISLFARQHGAIPAIKYKNNIFKITRDDPDYNNQVSEALENYDSETLVLCGFNATRIRLNKYLRAMLGFEQEEPAVNDRVICLKNNYQKRIYNGMLGTIISIEKGDVSRANSCYVNIEMDGESNNYRGSITSKSFNLDPKELEKELPLLKRTQLDIFDFGYAMTVHKAQGSQAKKVILFEERFSKMDDQTWKRWLYTAVTRASDELVIFG